MAEQLLLQGLRRSPHQQRAKDRLRRGECTHASARRAGVRWRAPCRSCRGVLCRCV